MRSLRAALALALEGRVEADPAAATASCADAMDYLEGFTVSAPFLDGAKSRAARLALGGTR